LTSSEHDRIRIQHMVEAAEKAVRLVEGRQRADLDAPNDPLADALVHLCAVVGEAASRLTTEAKDLLPNLPWREIIGMRNRLIHAYHDINRDILWLTVVRDLPVLLEHLRRFPS
jgi:uncharacterized protein with HEPN domain